MLSLIAWMYGRVVALRNYLYDRGVLDTFDLGAYTVSIGNITAGGTGKTPLVAYVARLLAERGETVCILTRGYKRKNGKHRVLVTDGERLLADALNAGDEPRELAEKLLGKVIVIADADRVSAGEWARRRFGVSAFVLDDGFQHRRVRRDVDIVCVDSTAPFGDGKILPAGQLREPVGSLSRADMIVLTRTDLVEDISDLRTEISKTASGPALFAARNRITDAASLRGKKLFAFCGLGNPGSFFSQLRSEGAEVVGTRSFADHHYYSQPDIDKLRAAAKDAGADALATTPKDAVKLSQLDMAMPIYVVEIDLELDDPERFAAMI